MRALVNKILIAAVVLGLLALVVVFFWQKEKIFPLQLKTPLSAGEIAPNLAGVLEKAGLAVSESPVVLGDRVIASVSGIRVVFAKDKDFSSQVRALQLVLGRLTIDKVPKEIDLRFNKVIIRYAL